MVKLLPLKGYKSLRALNCFHTLMLGMKMLPQHIGESYEAFYKSFSLLSDSEKETMIREAALFVELTPDEVEAIICFCADANGIPYTKANISNLGPAEILECVVAVCCEIGKIKIDMVTEAEKKK